MLFGKTAWGAGLATGTVKVNSSSSSSNNNNNNNNNNNSNIIIIINNKNNNNNNNNNNIDESDISSSNNNKVKEKISSQIDANPGPKNNKKADSKSSHRTPSPCSGSWARAA